MGISKLFWKDVRPGSFEAYAARMIYRPGDAYSAHLHDFAEIFWVESGVLSHGYNGSDEKRMEAGELVFLAPGSVHALTNKEKRKATIVNVAFSSSIYEQFSSLDGDMKINFVPEVETQRHFRLSSDYLMRMEDWLIQLLKPQTDRADMLAFLLDIYRGLKSGYAKRHNMPVWLSCALAQYNNPVIMAEGMNALVRLTGRTRQHIARSFQTHLEMTPTEYANCLRASYAAAQLRLTDKTVLQICDECGITNPTYFYRLFKSTYGMTPGRFRRHI